MNSKIVTILHSTFLLISRKRKFFLAAMILDMDLLIDKHFFHDPTVLARTPGLQVSLTTVSLAILYMIWFFGRVTEKTEKPLYFPRVTMLLIGYIASEFLSMFNSENTLMSMYHIFFTIQMFLMLFYLINNLRDINDIKYIFILLLTCLLIQSLVCLIQYSILTGFNLTGKISKLWVENYVYQGNLIKIYRVIGTAGSPNTVAAHIAMLLPLVLTMFFFCKSRIQNLALFFLSLVGIMALLLTFSRGGWMSLGAGLLALLGMNLRYRRVSGKKMITMAIVIVVIVGALSPLIVTRLSQNDRGAAWARIPLMKLAFNMIRDKPLIGVGVNNFGVVTPRYLTPDLEGEWIHLVHNTYLLIFAETGMLGITFFLLFIGHMFQMCFRCIKSNDTFLKSLSIGMLAGLVGYSCHMMVDINSSRITVQLLWTMAAILTVSETIVLSNARKATPFSQSRGTMIPG